MPLSSDLQVMPLRCQTSPWGSTRSGWLIWVSPVQLGPAGALASTSNELPHSCSQLAGFGSRQDLSPISQRSALWPSYAKYVQAMFFDGDWKPELSSSACAAQAPVSDRMNAKSVDAMRFVMSVI